MVQQDTYIITALQAWGSDITSNVEYMAREISRTHKVLYVNPPLDMLTLLKGVQSPGVSRKNRVLRGSEQALRHIDENLWVLETPIVVALPTKIYSDVVFDLMNRNNNRHYGDAILWALRHLSFERFNLVIDNDIFRSFFLDEFLSPSLSIYYRRDNPFSIGYWRRHGRRLEPELVRRSDIVVASSDPLAEDVRPYNYNTYSIGRGVDLYGFDMHKKYEVPADMRAIRHPIIGFAGILGVLLTSANLLHSVARCYPDCSIVLIGAQDNVFSRHGLHDMSNVYFLGERSGSELAGCISQFDVCLSPQVFSDLTRANFPDNMVQYLSLGKSVVCMSTLPTAIFIKEVFMTEDNAHFLNLISIALREHPGEALMNRRAQLAHSLSWESCVERLYALVDMVNADIEQAEELLSEEVYS